MYLLGHVGIALLVSVPSSFLLIRAGRARTAGITLFALTSTVMAPDVDLLLPVAHRGITHTVWVALLVGGLFAAAGRRLGARIGVDEFEVTALGFGVGTTSVVAHLLGDVITPMGIRPFAPLLDVEYSAGVVAASDPAANVALFVAGCVAASLAVGGARVGGATPAGSSDRRAGSTTADPGGTDDPVSGD